MSEVNLRIDNMHCGACVRRVTQALNALAGVRVEEVQIGAARVQLADGPVTTAALVEAVSKAGFPAHLEG
jgi:copper chaperone